MSSLTRANWDWVKTREVTAPLDTEFVIEHLVIGEEGRARGESSSTSSASTTPTTTPATPTLLGPSPTTLTTGGTIPTAPVSPTTPSSSPAPGEDGSDAGAATTPPPTTTLPAVQPQIELATPLEDDEDRLDAFYDDEPLRYHKVTNILGDVSPPGLAPRLFAQLHPTHTGEPINYAEARGDPAWEAAMKQKIESVEKNKTWELVDLPAGHRPITLKWVFKLKKDEKGSVIKHKARLVVRGFV